MGRRTSFADKNTDFMIIKKGCVLRLERIGDAFRLMTTVQSTRMVMVGTHSEPQPVLENITTEIVLDKDEAIKLQNAFGRT